MNAPLFLPVRPVSEQDALVARIRRDLLLDKLRFTLTSTHHNRAAYAERYVRKLRREFPAAFGDPGRLRP